MDNLILRSDAIKAIKIDAIKAACAGASYSDIKKITKKITKKIKNVPAVHVKPEWVKVTEEEIKQND